jgi:hypothetical protein
VTSPILIDEPKPSATSPALILRTLRMQYERLRAIGDKYSEMFYQLIIVGQLTIILMAMASMTDALRATALLIPFFVIYIGVQSAYFLSHVISARVYATGLEQRINRLLKDDVLIAHRQEAAYLFPLGGAQFAGVSLRLRQTFFGFMTIHFWLTGGACFALAAYRAWQLLPELEGEFPPARYYFWALGAWALLHLAYLVWYFGSRHYERRIKEVVSEAYQTEYDGA